MINPDPLSDPEFGTVEVDRIVDAWFMALGEYSRDKAGDAPGAGKQAIAVGVRAGYLRAVIRCLSAEVPGVREWLLNHMPEIDT